MGNVADGGVPIPELAALPDLPPLRMQERQSLKRALDGYVAGLANAPKARKSGTKMSKLSRCSTPRNRARRSTFSRSRGRRCANSTTQSVGTSATAGSPISRSGAPAGHRVGARAVAAKTNSPTRPMLTAGMRNDIFSDLKITYCRDSTKVSRHYWKTWKRTD